MWKRKALSQPRLELTVCPSCGKDLWGDPSTYLPHRQGVGSYFESLVQVGASKEMLQDAIRGAVQAELRTSSAPPSLPLHAKFSCPCGVTTNWNYGCPQPHVIGVIVRDLD